MPPPDPPLSIVTGTPPTPPQAFFLPFLSNSLLFFFNLFAPPCKNSRPPPPRTSFPAHLIRFYWLKSLLFVVLALATPGGGCAGSRGGTRWDTCDTPKQFGGKNPLFVRPPLVLIIIWINQLGGAALPPPSRGPCGEGTWDGGVTPPPPVLKMGTFGEKPA